MRTQRPEKAPTWSWLVVTACFVATLSCNLATTSPPAPGLPVEPANTTRVATLEIVNGLPEDICVLYLSYTTAPSWGINRLEDAAPIPALGAITIDLPANRYDLLAESCSGEISSEIRDLDVTDSRSTMFTTTTASVVGQEESVVVWLEDNCSLPTVTTNTPVVVRVPWLTATPDQAASNAEQLRFTLIVDDQPISVEPTRSAVQVDVPLADLDCPEGTELRTLVYWDFPIGTLQPGSHAVLVEYYANEPIDDGYDTYEAGRIGDLWRVFDVTGG